ncbi:MAG: sensor histidine kinase [Bauldia sp.]|nr:sensor histidine kinase [Bauldia sp.]
MSEEPAVRARPGLRSGFPEWLYLGFLVFLFLGPLFNPDSTATDWVVAAITAVVSAAIFMVAIRYRGGVRTPAAVAILVVGVVSTWLGTAAMGVLPIYAAALVAGFVSRRVLVWRLGAITLLTVAAMALSPIPPPFVFLAFGPALPLIWLIGFSVEADVDLSRQTISLRAENARVQYLATVTERERIARDLHDLAGQALTAIALRSQLVQRLAETDPARAIEEASAIESTARDTLASVRETVAGWQQVALTDELDKATTALNAAGIETTVSGVWRPDLAPSVETVLALALREAVTNVVRHAHARSCRISLDEGIGEVALLVSDDGGGVRQPEGSGLRGMRERVTAAGGRLRVTTGPGTSLRVTMPAGAP